MRFAFVHAKKAEHAVASLCRVMNVTRQGYYQYLRRGEPQRVVRDRAVAAHLVEAHRASRFTYGSPRLLKQLRDDGVKTCKKQVERLVRALGLNAESTRRMRRRSASNDDACAPNSLARHFGASRPNEKWVTDITYVHTDEGWCYLAVVLDLYARAVIGWAMSSTADTHLVRRALEEALLRRKPRRGLLHHSDRGCQYTAGDYLDALTAHGIRVSMSRVGNCWDNAVAESFFATLKKDLVHRHPWRSRLELRAAVFDYIECFYNRKRLHSAIGYRAPATAEAEYHAAQAA